MQQEGVKLLNVLFVCLPSCPIWHKKLKRNKRKCEHIITFSEYDQRCEKVIVVHCTQTKTLGCKSLLLTHLNMSGGCSGGVQQCALQSYAVYVKMCVTDASLCSFQHCWSPRGCSKQMQMCRKQDRLSPCTSQF